MCHAWEDCKLHFLPSLRSWSQSFLYIEFLWLLVLKEFWLILHSVAVCISDEALYAVVDPFDDFACIGFKKRIVHFSSLEMRALLFLLFTKQIGRILIFFIDFWTSMDKIRASFLRMPNNHAAENTCTRNLCSKHQKSYLPFLFPERNVLSSRQAPLVPGEFWDSFTNHSTGNYLRHGINLTANQRLSPTLLGNQNTIKDGATQTTLFLYFFFWGEGSAAHKLVVSSKFVLFWV